MKKIVVLSGAGVSAESGINTFRGADGLWEGHDVTKVASPQGWSENQELVLDFYNQRRKQVLDASPNKAHKLLAELENYYDISIITQNIDDLHERAGSSSVLHLHGEIRKCRSSKDDSLIYPVEGWELKKGQLCEKGSQLRPHVVWFGEMVPMMEPAAQIVHEADIFIVIGTSLQVYPAASLLSFVKKDCELYVIDPESLNYPGIDKFHTLKEKATTGMEILFNQLVYKK